MDKIFQRIVESNFSELAGTSVDTSIPVPQSLVNEVIAAALRGNKTIHSCQISFHAQNRVSVDLKTNLLPWALQLKLKLDNSVDFASFSSPKIRAWLENNRLLGSLGSLFHALPEGVKLYGDQVVVDLGSFLHTPEQRRILDLIKSVEIRTAEGKMVLNVKI